MLLDLFAKTPLNNDTYDANNDKTTDQAQGLPDTTESMILETRA